MARKLDPIWDFWHGEDGHTVVVGDLGFDLEAPPVPVATVSTVADAKLLVMVLKHIDARLP